jgi:hypothetical protein
MGGECSTHRTDEKYNEILIPKPEMKRPCRRPRHGQKDNISMVFGKTGCEGANWVHLAQDRLL